jgi:hypothetical protein
VAAIISGELELIQSISILRAMWATMQSIGIRAHTTMQNVAVAINFSIVLLQGKVVSGPSHSPRPGFCPLASSVWECMGLQSVPEPVDALVRPVTSRR